MKIRTIPTLLSLAITLSGWSAAAERNRSLLTGKLSEDALPSSLVQRHQWKPYPTVSERDAWNRVPAKLRAAHVAGAERLLQTAWTPLPASVFLQYARDGNRSNFERLSFDRRQKLAGLVLAEVFEGQGRFLEDIGNGIWAICEESFWGVPAHLGMQRRGTGLPDVAEPTVDLFAAETGSLLAWTFYLLGDRLDRVSPLLNERIYLEVERRILTPCLERDDFWWMGFGARREVNNWNPWINSNWLAAALILERDSARREKAVYKIMRSLDNFLNGYPDDGGCDEGPGYWGRAGASLFECLEMLDSATKGAVDIFNAPLVHNIGKYIYRVYIKDDYYINFADASAKNSPEAGLIYRYGKRINDPMMTGFGAFLARRQELGGDARVARTGSLGRLLPDLLLIGELQSSAPVEPLLRDFWLPGLQVMGARSYADSARGLYLAAKGGHNAESHNHNDVGNFIVYADGKPAVIDVGVETYTAKTFSSKRYEIWTMQSAYHNLPTINGVPQKDGRQYQAQNVAYTATDAAVTFSLDIAKAYPEEARVDSWLRTLTLVRGKRIQLAESYKLKEFVQPFSLSLMTPLLADTSTPGKVLLVDSRANPGLSVIITYDSGQLKASAEPIEVTDGRLLSAWGQRLTRVLLVSSRKSLHGEYQIEIEQK